MAQAPIGSWRSHLPYKNVVKVADAGNRVVAATPNSIFTVNTADNNLEKYNKITGLNEAQVQTIAADKNTGKIYIAYNNGNVDILTDDKVQNMPYWMRSSFGGDKTINSFKNKNETLYISTQSGIVVVNELRNEITETWFLGSNGSYLPVNDFASDAFNYYAATPKGLLVLPVTAGMNPADYRQWYWKPVDFTDSLPVLKLVSFNDKCIAWSNNALYAVENGPIVKYYTPQGLIIDITANAAGNELVITEQINGTYYIITINTTGTVAETIALHQLPHIQSVIKKGNDIWVGDALLGLNKMAPGSREPFSPNGPAALSTGPMAVVRNRLLAAAVHLNNSNYAAMQDTTGVHLYENEQWSTFKGSPAGAVTDINAVAVSSKNGNLWAAAFNGGLIKINGSITAMNENILAKDAATGNYISTGVAVDASNNVWVSNYGAGRPLVVLQPDNTVQHFAFPFAVAGNATGQVKAGNNNDIYIIIPGISGGVIVLNTGGTINNTADDKWKMFKPGSGNGNLPGRVLSLTVDMAGFVWVGTDNGVAVIQCPAATIFSEQCNATWPVVQQGNFAGFLLAGVAVEDIAVDGANRKWLATANGVYQVNETGQKVIQHFTADNSPLLHNQVKAVAVNGITGEVFFSTIAGICSFKADATNAVESGNELLVYPNPVLPGYNGTIAIKGLPHNALVKITELSGRLIYQARANGGQAVWNGKNYNGQKIASGVYLVLAQSDDGKNKQEGKIIFLAQ